MSFITKRERVFNEYDLFDLPARNEGKLKAYASCTDARAWSHFGSDQTEHLVEVIKRNNETCRPKYVPTDVIVDTIMIQKNAEIGRLKRKIEEFEQMLEAYDQLDLTCDQKCEIEAAHNAIKAANKQLDDLCLDLDLSGFTEGIDSEAFQTGKSRGDSACTPKPEWVEETTPVTTDSKNIQSKFSCVCDVSTACTDPRIQHMEETIISKDAKLSAMQNTIAVMSNDVCEPYCIYAHIHTALVKIFEILCQNDKYKLYLSLMTAGRDTRCIDIKGKILFKLKVLEKFSLALVAPCSQDPPPDQEQDCACYRAEIEQIEQAFALTTETCQQPFLDNKRAQLVADIMEHDEMKEILSKDSASELSDDQSEIVVESYDIESENLKRLKDLQESYDGLLTCYENINHEKDCLQIRCQKYEELEKEYEVLRAQLREYNLLWNEKEHYRKRSNDLDSLKEQFLILKDETVNVESQLKTGSEIIKVKTNTIDDLRKENIGLEQKFNDALINFEKEKNALQCKLKETECKVMCQEQQIKSLSVQIDRLLEQEKGRAYEESSDPLYHMNEIESLKEQVNNLKDALYCNDEEKQSFQKKFQDALQIINKLRMEIEDRKSDYEKTQHRNNCLENFAQEYENELQQLREENKNLVQEVDKKTTAVNNLLNVVNNKSQEIDVLLDEVENKKKEIKMYNRTATSLESEKVQALESLVLAKKESQELINKVKDYDEIMHKQESITDMLETKIKDCDELREALLRSQLQNRNLEKEINTRENSNAILLQEIENLHKTPCNEDINSNSTVNNSSENESKRHENLLELMAYENEILTKFQILKQELCTLKNSYQMLIMQKDKLESELRDKTNELDDAIHSVEMSRKDSNELIAKLRESENLNDDLIKLTAAYDKLLNDKRILQKELSHKNDEINNMFKSVKDLKLDNYNLSQKCEHISNLEQKLRQTQDELLSEKKLFLDEINNLHNNLQIKIGENGNLLDQIRSLENSQMTVMGHLNSLKKENSAVQNSLEAARKESAVLMDKVKQCETLKEDFDMIKRAHHQIQEEKEILQQKFDTQLVDLQKVLQENNELHRETQSLFKQNEDLENALVDARNQIIAFDTSQDPFETIRMEIELMKEEKIHNQKCIRDLSEKLDESEHIITKLSEDIAARDDKIAISENHINDLKKEVRLLQEKLEDVMDAGEQIQKTSSEKIDQTLKNIEAHHSKAAHNMKMELVKLQTENSKMEDRISDTALRTREYEIDRDKYKSQVIYLQNEREIIITDIKQLEVESVGDSELTIRSSTVEDILTSLDRIRRTLNAKKSKSNSLEQTLLKVQNSSQLLLREAKDIVEKEKQKIMSEKEEAIRDRLNMQKQLEDQKAHLEKEMAEDKEVISGLEAEIQNQKLIMNKINKSTQNYISKLEEEMNSLKVLYQTSMGKVNELQEKNNKTLSENDNQKDMLKKSNIELELKCQEIANLQEVLNEIKNKPSHSLGVQVSTLHAVKNDVASQTDKIKHTIEFDRKKQHTIELDNNENNSSRDSDMTTIQREEVKLPGLLPQQIPHPVNEVQILTANIEPSFDFVKNCYKNYKLKQLKPILLEQYSISNVGLSNQDDIGNSSGSGIQKDDNLARTVENTDLIDIYSRRYLNSNSSKEKETNRKSSIENLAKTSGYRELTLKNDTMSSNKGNLSSSSDKDLLIIYKDSDTSYIDETLKNEKVQDDEQNNDNIIKAKLNIKLPRVDVDSSMITSDGEKKSLDSYTINIYSSPEEIKSSDINMIENLAKERSGTLPFVLFPNEEKQGHSSKLFKNTIHDSHTRTQKKVPMGINIESHGNVSHHKLSRVDADAFLMKSKNGPEAESTSKTIFRKTRSDEMFDISKTRDETSNGLLKQQLLANKIASSSSTSDKTSHKDSSKSVMERSVMAEIDSTEDYKAKINYLTKILENKERDYKRKIEAMKEQYDTNIKSIINEHNHGVRSIQNLHEETLQDIIKIHENEVENLRTLSIEAMRKTDKLEKENWSLKTKIQNGCSSLFESEPSKMPCCDVKKRKKTRSDSTTLTKTNVEAFYVKPKSRNNGPCTCSLDVDVSDTIRNIFEQVDVEQKKLAEHTYMKYIINKLFTCNFSVEDLDDQELSFLHLKVCRTWKAKLNKDHIIQKLVDKRRNTQQHIAELDRRVAEEKRRLQETRESVCRVATMSYTNPDLEPEVQIVPPPTPEVAEKELLCYCNAGTELEQRRSAGDLQQAIANSNKPRRIRTESNRAIMVRMGEEQREKRHYNDEPPTRLRRTNAERQNMRKK